MEKQDPLKLSSLFRHSRQLNFLRNKITQQQIILQQLQRRLASPLKDHCIHARIDGSRMIIHTDSAVWASQLRFQAPDILRAFRKEAPALKKLEVRILPCLPDHAALGKG